MCHFKLCPPLDRSSLILTKSQMAEYPRWWTIFNSTCLSHRNMIYDFEPKFDSKKLTSPFTNGFADSMEVLFPFTSETLLPCPVPVLCWCGSLGNQSFVSIGLIYHRAWIAMSNDTLVISTTICAGIYHGGWMDGSWTNKRITANRPICEGWLMMMWMAHEEQTFNHRICVINEISYSYLAPFYIQCKSDKCKWRRQYEVEL